MVNADDRLQILVIVSVMTLTAVRKWERRMDGWIVAVRPSGLVELQWLGVSRLLPLLCHRVSSLLGY